jgi:hypothetical protein
MRMLPYMCDHVRPPKKKTRTSVRCGSRPSGWNSKMVRRLRPAEVRSSHRRIARVWRLKVVVDGFFDRRNSGASSSCSWGVTAALEHSKPGPDWPDLIPAVRHMHNHVHLAWFLGSGHLALLSSSLRRAPRSRYCSRFISRMKFVHRPL